MSNGIMTIWGFIVVSICGVLVVLGNVGDDYDLYKLEKKIKYASSEYFSDSSSSSVSINYLIDEGYLRDNDLIDKYCVKKVIKEKKYFIFNKYNIIKDCEES